MPKRETKTRIGTFRRIIGCWPLLLSVAMVAASFAWYAASPLIFLALLPVWYLLHRGALQQARPALTIGLLWLTGFLSYLCIFGWIVQTDPSQWSNAGGPAVQTAHLFAWALFAFTHSLVWAVFALVATRFRGKTLLSPWAIVVLPSAWVLGELLRALVTSLVFWGPEGLVGPHWHFGSLGFAAAGTPLVFAGRWLGLAGLSFLVVAGSLALYWLSQRQWKAGVISIAVLAALAGSGFAVYRNANGVPTRAGVIHFEGTQNVFETSSLALAGSAPRNLDVLVLPEYSGLYTESTWLAGAQQQIEEAAFGDQSGLVIAAGYGSREGQRVGQIGYYVDGQPISLQEKQFLMPTGEYMPSLLKGVIRASGSPVLLPRFDQARRVNPGREPEHPVTYADRTYGTLSCSGVLSPHFYARLARDGAQILTNPTSLVIFRESDMFTEQNKQMVRYQAVANARPFVQSARSARSYVVDHNGRFVLTSESPLEIASATVTTNRTKTVSSWLGDWPIILLAIAAIAGWLVRRRRG